MTDHTPAPTSPKPNVGVLAQDFAYGTFQRSITQLAALGFSVVGALETVLGVYGVKLDPDLVKAVGEQADYIDQLAEMATGEIQRPRIRRLYTTDETED
jgi:hypothetical protein